MPGQCDHDLRKTEQSDGERHEADAVVQLRNSECPSWLVGRDVETDRAEQQTHQDHGDRFEDAAARKHDCGDQTARHQRRVIRGFEARRHRGQGSRQGSEEHRTCRAADKGADRCNGQSHTGAPLARHRVAIEARHRGRSFTRQVDENRRDGAAVLSTVINARQRDHGPCRRQ
jgi:hypothetical protein